MTIVFISLIPLKPHNETMTIHSLISHLTDESEQLIRPFTLRPYMGRLGRADQHTAPPQAKGHHSKWPFASHTGRTTRNILTILSVQII